MKEYNRKLRLNLQLILGSDGATNAKQAGSAEQATEAEATGATEQATEAGATGTKEQASRGDVEHSSKRSRDSVGGSTSDRLPSTSKKAKLTLQPSIPKVTRTPTPKIVNASVASRLNAGFDELTWDAEGAYEGAFKADAANLDDADDDAYVPESGDEGGPSLRHVSESLRTTRGSKACRRVNFNGEDQDDTFASQLQRDAVAASVLLEKEELPRRHVAAATGKPCGSTEKQKVKPNAPLDMLPEGEDSIDRLLGMNTIVPDADGVFFGDFPTRRYSWNRFTSGLTSSPQIRINDLLSAPQHRWLTEQTEIGCIENEGYSKTIRDIHEKTKRYNEEGSFHAQDV
ncbi:hypothetical protein PHYPSEUDO_004233 [Phytophthora pseudosyringae]|uniref:Uncharacterized protein n=1 Tax=Phytophthora pseudosyringae TaxID=221518 RepID=A0A8T1VNS8_9STRA|nr:hypothetical protein PHYPSEUDO_004233 [Phytophthora pseudosyringae]